MSKYMGSIHHFYSGWRIVRLKTQKVAPTPLWWLWSCNCHTGPSVVLELKEQKGASKDQVNKHYGNPSGWSIACILSRCITNASHVLSQLLSNYTSILRYILHSPLLPSHMKLSID